MFEDTPILIIAWIRTDKVEILFKQLKSFGCKNIFLSLDGPRNNNYRSDLIAINKIEKLALEIFDEKIKVKKNVTNLGCKFGVKSAIDWFFENVGKGIILEDDIIPEIEFIKFCTFYLKHYEKNKNIFSVSGLNGYKNWLYYSPMKTNELSRRWFVWGWATWKDRWIDNYSEKIDLGFDLIIKIFKFYEWDIMTSVDFLVSILKVNLNYIDTWDFQVQAICIQKNFLNVIPKSRYIKNIGFDNSATHTSSNLGYFENINKFLIQKEYKVQKNLPVERENQALLAIRSNYLSGSNNLLSNIYSCLIFLYLIISYNLKK